MNKSYCVYKLTDPRDFTIRWIGITCKPKQRWEAHTQDTKDRFNVEKVTWTRELKESGHTPIIDILIPDLTRQQALHEEMLLIHELLEQGVPLLNRNKRWLFSHWTRVETDSPIAAYKVMVLPSRQYWIVGIIDEQKRLYCFMKNHQVYQYDFQAYSRCKRLNQELKERIARDGAIIL